MGDIKMSEYKDMFIEEAREHLQTLNQTLLDFEENPKNVDALNQIFRAAHTLKGMAAAMNYDKIQKLSHKTEDTLDLIRNNQLDVSTEIVDLIFDCFDGLEKMVEDIAAQDATNFDIEGLIERLEKHMKDVSGEKKKEVTTEKKVEIKTDKKATMPSLEKTVEGKIIDEINIGKNAFKLDITVDEACKMKSIRSFILLKKLRDVGDIAFAKPDEHSIEDGTFDQGFELILLTSTDRAKVQQLVQSVSELALKLVTPLLVQNDQLILEYHTDIEKNGTTEQKVIGETTEGKQENKETKQAEKKDQKEKIETSKTGGQSIRVGMDQLDDFMNLIGELVISKGRLGQIAADNHIEALSETVNIFERLTTELQDKIMGIRMIPMSHIFNRFPRMIRDLAKSNNKKINLNIVGEGIELDRTILDEIGDPIVHLLRNSVDHGIETPEERKKMNKPETGTIDLIADRKRNHVLIEIKDDGKGIDPNSIRQAAVKKGLRTQEEVNALSDQEALDLLWLPGLSTAEKVTNVSGRGVGMDVVKSTIKKLNGTVEYSSEIGKGSTFSLKLPLTMAIFKALFVGIGNETYAIPINNVIEIVKFSKNEVKNIGGKPTTVLRNDVLPLISLASLLDVPQNNTDTNEIFTVIVQKEDKKYGITVESLIGEQEITIKNVGGAMKKTKGIAGVTITGDGRVILVTDINTLIDETLTIQKGG